METLAEQFRLNYIEEGIEIGKKIGREEGREEGRVEGMVEIVRRLMSRGFTQDEALDIACPDDYRSKVVSRLNGSERFLQ
jgi:flagellar biosynthesis/type III secretory pathway protein FliH